MEENQRDISAEELAASMAFLAHKRQQKAAQVAHHRERKRDAHLYQPEADEKVLAVDQVIKGHTQYEAWRMRAMGYSILEIADELKRSEAYVRNILSKAALAEREGTEEFIGIHRQVELKRTEIMLKHYMPLSLMDSITLQRIRAGEPVEVDSLEYPLRSAFMVLEIIKLRAKLMGLYPKDNVQPAQDPADLVSWLHTQLEFIQGMAVQAPKDVLSLELETDTNIDKANGTNGTGKTD
jgi:hypothetical protein